KGVRWYRSQFSRLSTIQRLEQKLGKRVYTFEATPSYMFYSHVPQRIAGFLPSAKLIVLLRDPVARAYSHFRHMVQRGREKLSFADALDQETARLAEGPSAISYDRFSYLLRGHYKAQLENLFKHFPREQVLILKSEELFSKTQSIYDEVVSFLKLDAY